MNAKLDDWTVINWNKVHYLLSEKNIKQKDLAECWEVTESTISRWLNGSRDIRLDCFIDLLLELEIDDIRRILK